MSALGLDQAVVAWQILGGNAALADPSAVTDISAFAPTFRHSPAVLLITRPGFDLCLEVGVTDSGGLLLAGLGRP
jgi:hypothetical protein